MSESVSLGPKHPFIYGNYGYEMATDIKTEIRMNLRNILLTNPGEWPGDENLGAGITQIIFDNKKGVALEILRHKIISQIQTYLPVVIVKSVDYSESPNNKNLVNFSLVYTIPDLDVEDTISIMLDN